jgi:short-subunit dehydrogenase
MMRIFAQLLKPDGSIVLLTAREEELLSAIAPEFTVKRKTRVLVSGKKAGIFHITFRT